MSMKRILLLFALAVIIPTSAFAVAGTLSTLTLAFPDGTPPEIQEKVSHYLTHDLALIEGKFMSTHITQSFSGSTSRLSELIQMLHTNQFALNVGFADLKDDRVNFLIYQNMAGRSEATITINTTKKDFKWSELKIQIPSAKRKIEPDAPPNTPASNKPK